MKTAQEWTHFFDAKSMHFCLSSHADVVVEAIKQIQLDALKEGYKRAAKIAKGAEAFHAKSLILSVSETLTIKDL